MSKAEELQQKLNELQAEIDALKEEEKKQPLKAMLPEEWDEDGFIVDNEGGGPRCAYYEGESFGVCPPFPSKELARQAVEALGIERIKRAYATLSNIKGEGV